MCFAQHDFLIGTNKPKRYLTIIPYDLHKQKKKVYLNVTYVFGLQFLVGAPDARALQLVQRLEQRLLVLEAQLLGDDGQVAHRLHFAVDVNDIGILEGTFGNLNNHVECIT